QPATLLLRRRLVGGFGGCRGTHGPAWTATNLARTFVLLHFGDDAWRPAGGCRRTGRCRGRSSSRGRSGPPLGRRPRLAKALLGFGLGLALGLFVGAMAFVFGLAAGFGGLTLGLLDALAAGAALGFLFGLPPLFLFANASVGERADARGMLILGQRAQHD